MRSLFISKASSKTKIPGNLENKKNKKEKEKSC